MTFVPPAKFVKGTIIGNAAEPISDPTADPTQPLSPPGETPRAEHWKSMLAKLGGWDNELAAVPAGGVRKLIEEFGNLERELRQSQTMLQGSERINAELREELRQAQEDHIAVVIHAKQCEERAEQAQERIEELEVELAASDGVAFNLSEHAKCVEKDAARYRWLQDWYLREGKRSEIDEFGHIRQTTALIMDASIDAAASGPERGR